MPAKHSRITPLAPLILLAGVMSCQNQSKKTEEPSIESTPTNRIEFVPEWAKKAIWYQIFPERFRNGDPSNDPTVQNILGADPQEPPKKWHIHDWGSDWYELQDYELENGEPELWKHLLRRRYGGDLQGIIDKLDYLKELGITAIYLNPVFESPSLHKYDGASYHHIDPNFGPDPEGDRLLMSEEDPGNPATWVWTKADELALKLIEEAHNKDMRIIFDGVFNHLGVNSFAFKDLLEKQEQSAYKDWFTVKSFRNENAGTQFEYEGWWGVPSLPELREDENGIVEGPSQYIFAATERWMNPKNQGSAHGIDGWRLDVAFCVDHQFWKRWRMHVKDLNPEAYLTAEIVDVPEKVIPYMQGDEFDGEMNYNFAFTCAEFFFNTDSTRILSSEFDAKLMELRNLYPPGVAYACQNLFGSHDVNRIGSHIVNRGIGNFRDWGTYYSLSKATENTNYSPRKPQKDDLALQKLFAIMQMTYVGAPMIYYGDEIGMWGGNDPDCRKPMVWDDISYHDEITNPDQSKHEPDAVEVNHALLSHYRRLIEIRKQHEALQTGDFESFIIDDENGIYGFVRTANSKKVWVILNNSDLPQTVDCQIIDENHINDLLNNEHYEVLANQLKIHLAARWGAILVGNH